MKRISAQAYQALREALSVITWNKGAFESTLRDALRTHPELLGGLDHQSGPSHNDLFVRQVIAQSRLHVEQLEQVAQHCFERFAACVRVV